MADRDLLRAGRPLSCVRLQIRGALVLLTLLALSPTVHEAAAQNVPSESGSWFDWQNMTGDWNGTRTQLKDEGIVINGHSVGEAAGNPVGGHEQGGAYADEFMIGSDVDLEKLAGITGGSFHVTITERAGSSLSKDKIDNILTVQEIYGDGQTTRLTQLGYEQTLFGGAIDLEVGRLITQTDFAASPTYWGYQIYCEFQSNAICGTPIAAPINSGYIAYPASAWGARIKAYPARDVYVETGAYEVNPTLLNASNGFSFTTHDDTGAFIPVEAGITIGDHPGGMIGNYRVGGYFDTSHTKDVQTQVTRFLPPGYTSLLPLPQSVSNGRYGFWVLTDQQIERDGPNSDRGIAVFGDVEFGDAQTALLHWFADTGIVRHGTFADRDNDTISLGFAFADINGRLRAFEEALQALGEPAPKTAQEMVLEANYGVAVAPWFTLRPGAQYVWHPSGEAELHNALVLDLQTVLNF